MSKVKNYTLEVCVPVFADLSSNDFSTNDKIVETAGFIPLDVKFKRFEQNGIIAQFQTNEFTSNDYRNLYANPDFEIYPDDELEDIEEKVKAYNDYRNQYIQEKKVGAFSEGKSPTQQAERASVKEQETIQKEEVSSE